MVEPDRLKELIPMLSLTTSPSPLVSASAHTSAMLTVACEGHMTQRSERRGSQSRKATSPKGYWFPSDQGNKIPTV
jgi:hypothetical protein